MNGVTLGIDTRGLVRTDQASAPADKRKTVRERLALVPGENVIEVVAYNVRSLIASLPASVKIVRQGSEGGVRAAPACARGWRQ